MPTMRCKHCRYRLDGLADNRCPECGEAFDPNDPEPQRDVSSVKRVMIALIALSYLVAYLFVVFILANFKNPAPPPVSDRLLNAIPQAIAPTAVPLVFFMMCWGVIDAIGQWRARREQD